MTRILNRLDSGHALTVLATFAVVLLMLPFTSTGWIVSRDRLVTTDYLGIHAAGITAREHGPTAVYDWKTLHAGHVSTLGYDQEKFFPFPYPPPYIAVAGSLSRLGYTGGALTFILASFAGFALVLWRILRSRDHVTYALASPATLSNAYVVQNGFLTSGLLGGGLVLLRTHPLTAGILIGLLALKPQLGIVIPFALAAGGYWRTVATAALTVIAACLASLAAWGTEPWLAFAQHLRHIFETSCTDPIVTRKLQTLFGALVSLGVPAGIALKAQAALATTAIAFVTFIWRTASSFELKAAALATAALLVSPYLFVYDLALIVIAIAFYMRHAISHGWKPYDLPALIGVNVPLLVAVAGPVPPGIISVLAMSALVAMRLREDAGFTRGWHAVRRHMGIRENVMLLNVLKPARADAEAAVRARRLLAHPDLRRIPLYCAILLLVFAVQLARNYGAPGGFIRDADGRPRLNDFAGVWTAGELVREGKPAAAYDWSAHVAKQLQLSGKERGEFYPWPYPPPFLAVAGLLAALPFGAAMLTWLVATFAAYIAVLRRITGHLTGALVLAAMPITLSNSFAGQNGFFSAALLGAGLLQMRSRPWLGGMLIGLLTYKPHLGLLVPLALLAGREWRALAGACLSAFALALGSLVLYGTAPWIEFIAQMTRVGETVAGVSWSYKFQSIYGLARTIGLSSGPALALQALALLAVAALLVHVWRRDTPYDLKAASLAVACALASPYIFIYDLTLLCVALAFLIRHAVAHDPEPAEVAGLVAVAGCFALFMAASVPAGLAASLLTGTLIARRIWPGLLPIPRASEPAAA